MSSILLVKNIYICNVLFEIAYLPLTFGSYLCNLTLFYYFPDNYI